MKLALVLAAAVLVAALPASAVTVMVEYTGTVEFNQVSFGQFGAVQSGDAVNIAFMVDSENFEDSTTYPTRGYEIDESSFTAVIGPVAVGLQDPFPAGQTPYFVMRDNDPAVDGFFLSRNVDFPNGLPLNEPANISDYFTVNGLVTYSGDTLSSLDILDALGTYEYDELQVFGFGLADGPFDAMGFVFESLTISSSVPTENSSWSEVKDLFR